MGKFNHLTPGKLQHKVSEERRGIVLRWPRPVCSLCMWVNAHFITKSCLESTTIKAHEKSLKDSAVSVPLDNTAFKSMFPSD